MRLPSFLSIVTSCVLLWTCGDKDENDLSKDFQFSGRITDALTGSPVRDMDVYSCPGTHFGNATVSLGEKILKGSTDECGYFSIVVPESEAGYSMHASTAPHPVLLFSSDEYGEVIKTFAESGEFNQELHRPLIDSVRWRFAADRATLVLEIKANSKAFVSYPEDSPMPDYIIPNGKLTIFLEETPGVMTAKNFENVEPDSWITHEVELASGQAILVQVDASGNSRSGGSLTFQIPVDRPITYTYVLPNAFPPCD